MYLVWQEKKINDFSPEYVVSEYNAGFVFTRLGHGVMNQTRSVRIDLKKFSLSSENRRVLKKTEGLELEAVPLPYSEYTWVIGKLGKDFYTEKFGDGTFSANKIKELLTDPANSNFNQLLLYKTKGVTIGYCITLVNATLLHYSYPFYDLSTDLTNLGLGMMLRAIMYAQETGKHYIYLGSFQRPTDTYKLQFSGLEWFNGEKWEFDLSTLKTILKN